MYCDLEAMRFNSEIATGVFDVSRIHLRVGEASVSERGSESGQLCFCNKYNASSMTSRWHITAYISCIFPYKLKFMPLLDGMLKRYLKKRVRKNEWSILGIPMSPIGGMFS